MVENLLAPLQFAFIQNALIISVLLSIAVGVIGTLIVVHKMVFLSGGVAHSTYGGIGLAIFCGFSPLLGAGLFGVIAALLMWWVVVREKQRSDMMIGVIWAVGMAFGVALIDLSGGVSGDLMSYLFGSLVVVERSDIWLFALLDTACIAWISAFYHKLLAISFDEKFAQTKGINVKTHNLVLLLFASLAVVMAIRAVGLMLVMALLTIPVWLAERTAKTLWQTMIVASVLTLGFLWLGLALAYALNITSGAAVIGVAAAAFVIGEVVRAARRKTTLI
ncbi:ABC transporter permease [Campylobacterota bacterium]|nr:ABC transporter permease [Campylobacterota bacterium]